MSNKLNRIKEKNIFIEKKYLSEQNTELDLPIIGRTDVAKIPIIGSLIAPDKKEDQKNFKKLTNGVIMEQKGKITIYRKKINNKFPKECVIIFDGFLNVGVKYSDFPIEIFNKRTVIVSDYNNDLNGVKKELEIFYNDKKSTLYKDYLNIKSVCGFSMGGRPTIDCIGSDGYFIGLIDPYLDDKSFNKVINKDLSNVKMIYGNNTFWKSLFQEHIFDNLEKLSKKMGNNSKYVDTFHLFVPKIFIKKYWQLM